MLDFTRITDLSRHSTINAFEPQLLYVLFILKYGALRSKL